VDQEGTNSGAPALVCHCCGQRVPEGNLAWDYPEPDPLFFLSEEERAIRLTVQTPQVVIVKGLGNFIRAILPVPVEHDREATFGVWLNIPELHEWNRVIAAASRGGDAWGGVKFAGRLATAVHPWPEVFGSWTQAVVPGPDTVPRLVHSTDPLLAKVLTDRWPEETIRSARQSHMPSDLTGGPTRNPYAGSFWRKAQRR